MKEFGRLAARLPSSVTRGDVEKVLRAVLSEADAWEWFTRARVPFPHSVMILRALRDGGYIDFQPTGLSADGRRLAQELGVAASADYRCSICAGSGVEWSELEAVYAKYLEFFAARPRGEDANLDQGAMTPASLFRRIALMIQQGDVANKQVAVLGDDDLASLALALTGLPAGVTVFEFDGRICQYIDRVAQAEGLKVDVLRQDLAKFFPREMRGKFDSFLCDPPETEAGLLLFVEKGLALLKEGDGRAGYFGATVVEASLDKWKHWQSRLIGRNEIAFTHILPPFTEYETWPDEEPLSDLPPLSRLSTHPWYRFAFYRLETLPQFRPLRDFETDHSELLYFDEESYYRAFDRGTS